jgi:uncharacterized protein YndB with AHSA1/START domain
MTLDKDNVIRVSKTFPVPVADVYAVFADEDFFDFCGVDMDTGEYDFRVGGAFSYGVDDGDFVKGTFKEIVPDTRLALTWSTMGLDGPTGDTLVTLTFKSHAKGCVVDLEHTGIVHRKTAKEHDEAWVEILEAIAEDLIERAQT